MSGSSKKVEITTGLICPCCGLPTRRQWQQEAMMAGRPPMSQTDCLNQSCAGYYMTLTVEHFFQRYASDKNTSAR